MNKRTRQLGRRGRKRQLVRAVLRRTRRVMGETALDLLIHGEAFVGFLPYPTRVDPQSETASDDGLLNLQMPAPAVSWGVSLVEECLKTGGRP